MGWTAIDRFGGDADGDGLLDDPSPRSPADLDVFAVRVHPSAAVCADLETAAWRVDGRLAEASLEPGEPCGAVVQVQGEGDHTIKVLARDRSEVAEVDIDDKLIVALGDSVASGEGNPERPVLDIEPIWLDGPCHRSAVAGFQQATQRLTEVEAHRSITFVSLACSGAETKEGLLEPYAGIAPKKNFTYAPQVSRLRRLGRTRAAEDGEPRVDAMLLSVGANDVHFSTIVRECGVSPGDCRDGHEEALQANLEALDGRYDRLGDAFSDAAPETPVLITEYFDPTHDEDGSFCSNSVGFTSRAEAQWAYEALLRSLNARVSAAADRNEWQLVDGIAADFERHGYCTGAQRWVRRLGESAIFQHDIWGTLHPNDSGHKAIAQRVVVPLADLLDFNAPQPPPEEGEEERSPGDWIGIVAAATVSPAIVISAVVVSPDPSSPWRWLLVSWLLLPLLAGLLVLIGRAALLLRPTWPEDPAGDDPELPKIDIEVEGASLTMRQLLLIAAGIAILFVVMVVIAGLVGRAILWLRFWSSQLPADQAVSEVSSTELVSTGAAALAIFVGLGLIAAAVAWLLDGKGRWVRATRRGLVAIGMAEVLAAILIGDFRFDQALELFIGLVIAALLLYFLVERALALGVERKEKARLAKAAGEPAPSRSVVKALWIELKDWGHQFAEDSAGGRARRLVRLAPLPFLIAAIYCSLSAEGNDRELLVLAPYLIAAILFAAPGGMAAAGVRWNADQDTLEEALDLPRIALALTGLACILILLVRDELWLAGVAATATVLGLLCLAVAAASKQKFGPYGLTVLVSVPLFAGAAAFLHGVDSPELQPVAAVLKDGRAICGAYVGESDDKLWVARLVLDERAGAHRPRRGSIAPVEAERIAARSLGSLESVDLVEARALELRDQLLDERGDLDPGKWTATCAPPELRPREASDWHHDLAELYQPELIMDRRDGFWPVPVRTLFSVHDRRAMICRRVAAGDGGCLRLGTPGEFPWLGGEGESLEYPAAGNDVDEQHDQMVEALGTADPEGSATEYYLVNREKHGTGPISIQYWFFYPFNYQPVAGGFAGAGFHEGDFESMGVLLSGKTEEPRYVWMARHDKEGRAFPWSDDALSRPEGHPRVYVARGSHATYENCFGQVRPIGVDGLADDHPACDEEHQLHLAPEVTPLTDLSRVGWACWHGRFGHVNGGLGIYEGTNKYLIADAPLSPLWQQNFGGVVAEPCRGVLDPGGRDGIGEEVLEEPKLKPKTKKTKKKKIGVPARLRRDAGRFESVIDDCSDWEQPTVSGTYMVACSEKKLNRYVKSGLEDAGRSGIRIEGTEPEASDEPIAMPAVRRNRAGAYLDDWQISAARPVRVSVYASCPSGHGIIAAHFEHVKLKPGRPLRLRNRGPGGTWLLTAPNGSPIADATPFPTKANKGVLVPAAPKPGKTLACSA